MLGRGAAAGGRVNWRSRSSTLPFDIAAHERAKDVGLGTQDLGAWAGDSAKANGISALIDGGIGTGALALIRTRLATGGYRAAPP